MSQIWMRVWLGQEMTMDVSAIPGSSVHLSALLHMHVSVLGSTSACLAAAVRRHGNSSQLLSIQWKWQPEEVYSLPLPDLACRKAVPVTSHALRLCHTPLGTREGIQIGTGSQPHLRSLNLQHGTCLNTHSQGPTHTHTQV